MKHTIRPKHTFAMLAFVGLAAMGSASVAEQGAPGFPADFAAKLDRSQQIYVATQRKDGTRSAVVPVWFAYVDNAIWFTTAPGSHKTKRLKRGSPMFVAVDSKDGPFIKTKADILTDGAMAERIGQVYSQKYWIAWFGFFRPSRARIDSGKTVLLKLTAE